MVNTCEALAEPANVIWLPDPTTAAAAPVVAHSELDAEDREDSTLVKSSPVIERMSPVTASPSRNDTPDTVVVLGVTRSPHWISPVKSTVDPDTITVACSAALEVHEIVVPRPTLRARRLPSTATLPHTSPLVRLNANRLFGLPDRNTLNEAARPKNEGGHDGEAVGEGTVEG